MTLSGIPPTDDEAAALRRFDPDVEVSAIVVNWNGREHLEVCLGSLLAQRGVRVEIVLVDNGSTDGSLEFVRERFGDRVRLLAQPENIGYGAALNRGVAVARGRHLLVLNNDTEVDERCLAVLVDAANRHPAAGSFAPKILSFDDRQVIDNVGHLLYADGLSRGRGRLERDHGQYDQEEDILLGSGCAMLLRRDMLAAVGTFDEDLFAYCEDTDLGLRARLAGWSCMSVPKAVVYHKYSASTAHYSPLKAFLVERNRIWVATKCLPWPLLALNPLFTLLRLGAQAFATLTGRGAAGRFSQDHSSAALAGILLRAWVAGTSGLPRAWRKRRRIQHTRRIPSHEALRWISDHGMGVREIAWKE